MARGLERTAGAGDAPLHLLSPPRPGHRLGHRPGRDVPGRLPLQGARLAQHPAQGALPALLESHAAVHLLPGPLWTRGGSDVPRATQRHDARGRRVPATCAAPAAHPGGPGGDVHRLRGKGLWRCSAPVGPHEQLGRPPAGHLDVVPGVPQLRLCPLLQHQRVPDGPEHHVPAPLWAGVGAARRLPADVHGIRLCGAPALRDAACQAVGLCRLHRRGVLGGLVGVVHPDGPAAGRVLPGVPAAAQAPVAARVAGAVCVPGARRGPRVRVGHPPATPQRRVSLPHGQGQRTAEPVPQPVHDAVPARRRLLCRAGRPFAAGAEPDGAAGHGQPCVALPGAHLADALPDGGHGVPGAGVAPLCAAHGDQGVVKPEFCACGPLLCVRAAVHCSGGGCILVGRVAGQLVLAVALCLPARRIAAGRGSGRGRRRRRRCGPRQGANLRGSRFGLLCVCLCRARCVPVRWVGPLCLSVPLASPSLRVLLLLCRRSSVLLPCLRGMTTVQYVATYIQYRLD